MNGECLDVTRLMPRPGPDNETRILVIRSIVG